MGDATQHQNGVLVHCVNDIGVMGAGIALAIAKKWPQVKKQYLNWSNNQDNFIKHNQPFELGYIQNVKVSDTLYVCNLVGQRGIQSYYDLPPLRYQSIQEGLYRLREFMRDNNLTELVSGRIGCGLAGGEWFIMEMIINHVFKDTDISVTIYDIEPWEGTVYE